MAIHTLKVFALVCVACLATAACEQIDPYYKELVEWVRPGEGRAPGERMKSRAEDVWARENCSNRPLPFLRLDTNEVHPAVVKPGEKLNHRLVYTLCADPRYGAIYGRNRTTLYYDSRKIYTNATDDFALKAGEWIVDADLVVPYDAKPGTYWLEAEFKGPGASFRDRTSFVVEP